MESIISVIVNVFYGLILFFFISVAASTVLYVIMFLCWLFYYLFLAPKWFQLCKKGRRRNSQVSTLWESPERGTVSRRTES